MYLQVNAPSIDSLIQSLHTETKGADPFNRH
jgi:hypothetical protein